MILYFINDVGRKSNIIEMESGEMFKEVLFDPFEIKIYSGLQNIGNEIAAFYKEGVRIVKYDNSEIKSYLLGHILREIDSSIRGVFSSVDVKKRISSEYGFVNKDHFADILAVLGDTPDSEFANNWFELAKEFPKIAHHESGFGIPRSPDDALISWKKYQEILLKLIGDYYSFVSRIEQLTTFERPTEQIIGLLPNLFKQPKKEEVFYRNLKSIEWFLLLKQAGFFNAETVPSLLNINGGFQFPLWSPLIYLEFVSQEISKEKDPNLSKHLFEIISNVTSRYLKDDSIDNLRIWNSFVRILVNLPNELVPVNILDLIPTWITSRFDNLTPSADICDHLLPKFLENPKGEDIKKAEIILIHLLTLKKIEHKTEDPIIEQFGFPDSQYVLKIKTYWLFDVLFREKQLINSVACYFSDDAIFKIIDQIALISNESNYLIWTESIKDMKEEDGYNNQYLFLIVFLKNLSIKQNELCPEKLNNLLIYLNTIKGNNTLCKKFILFIISLNWKKFKHVFFDLIKNNDEERYFSEHKLNDDIYNLLNTSQKQLTKREVKLLQTIINSGYIDKSEVDAKYLDYWQLRWYSALKENPSFSDQYEKLSLETKRTHKSYEDENKMIIRSGDISPITTEEILKLPSKEIHERIKSFNPDTWESDFTIRGFAECLGAAIIQDPNKFINELSLFERTPYIYVCKVISGYKEAWVQKKTFNVTSVLDFIWNYITQPDFGTENLRLANDHWGTNEKWVIREISELIKVGTDNDDWAFDFKLIPMIKKILTKFIDELSIDDQTLSEKITSVSYSLNSNAGHLLSALIYTSLRIARNSKKDKNVKISRWSPDLKNLFEKTIDKGIIDSYNLQGYYMSQFMFLDQNWMMKRLKINLDVPEELWTGFIQNFLFQRPFDKQNIYKLLEPHYRRALSAGIENDEFSGSNLGRHIVVCYFLGFENLEKGSLLSDFINNGSPKQIEGLIHFIWSQRKVPFVFIKEKPQSGKPKILKIWIAIDKRFRESIDIKEQNIIANLTQFIVFIDQIDESNIDLILDSAKYCGYHLNSSFLFEGLKSIKSHGIKTETETYICEIFNVILENYTPDFKKDDIYDLIQFLYSSDVPKIKENADKICNTYGERGYDFLRPLWEENNAMKKTE